MKLLDHAIRLVGMVLVVLLFLIVLCLSYFNDDQPTEDL